MVYRWDKVLAEAKERRKKIEDELNFMDAAIEAISYRVQRCPEVDEAGKIKIMVCPHCDYGFLNNDKPHICPSCGQLLYWD